MASPQQQTPVGGAASAASDPWTTPIVADKDDTVTPDAGGRPRRRVVQFGPSLAASFCARTPVAGSLQHLPQAVSASRYPISIDSITLTPAQEDDLRQTKDNASLLAAWDDVDMDSDDDCDGEASGLEAHVARSRRRASHLFSPSSKSLLLEEDDKDANPPAQGDSPPSSEDDTLPGNWALRHENESEDERDEDPMQSLMPSLAVYSPVVIGSQKDTTVCAKMSHQDASGGTTAKDEPVSYVYVSGV
jgi:hypothetical protein